MDGKGCLQKKKDKYLKIKNRKIGNIDLHMHAHTRLEVLREEKKGKLGSTFDPSVETELNQQSSMGMYTQLGIMIYTKRN